MELEGGGREGRINQEEEEEATRCAEMDEKKTSLSSSSRGKE